MTLISGEALGELALGAAEDAVRQGLVDPSEPDDKTLKKLLLSHFLPLEASASAASTSLC